MPKVNEMLMTRTGDFSIRVGGLTKCSTQVDGQKVVIRYESKVACAPVMDSRGWLFDVLLVPKYFIELENEFDHRNMALSCEELTMKAVGDILARIKTENPKVKVNWMELSLAPHPHTALMVFRWNGGPIPAPKSGR